MRKVTSMVDVFIEAFKSIRKRKTSNIIVITALFLGLLFPILVLSFGSAALSYIDSSLLKDYKHIVVIQVENSYLSESDIGLILDSNKDIECVTRSSTIRKLAIIGDKYIYTNVRTIDYNYCKFNNLNIIAGEDFNENSDSNLCIVGQKYLRDNLREKGLGEIINLAGHNYKVIGIINDAKLNDCIIIPTASAERLNLLSNNMTCYVKYKYKGNIRLEANELKNYIAGNFKRNFSIKVFEDVHKKEINNIIGFTLALFGVVVLVLCYSLLNIANIMLNNINENKKTYGIRIALGATNQDIYIQNFTSIHIQLVIASVIVSITIYIIGGFTNSIIGFPIIKLNLIVIIISVIMGILISSIMSFITLKKVMKLNVVEILRG